MSEYEIIVPNFNARFSGITATVAAVAPHQMKGVSIACIGHPLPPNITVPHLSLWRFFRLTGNFLPDGRPRIFHARRNIEMLWGLVFKYLARRKLYLLFTSTAQRDHTRWTRFLYNRMDSVISTSPRASSYVRRAVSAIIPHGVDTQVYYPAQDREACWKSTGLPGKLGVGIFGRVRPQKGIEEFVLAMCQTLARHPHWTAVIVGEVTPAFRSFERRLKTVIAKKGLSERFVWTEKRNFAELPELFRAMSLIVCASHNEGFGLTCLEGMASGVAVLATQTGAFEMAIRPGVDGYIVPCRNTQALVQGLEKMMADPQALARMGAAARARAVERFSIEKEAALLVAEYRKIGNKFLPEC